MTKNSVIILSAGIVLSVFFLFIGVPFSQMDDMILNDTDFPKDLLAVFILTVLVIFFVSRYTIWLDRRYPWGRSSFLQRGLYQSVGVLVPAAFIWTYIYGYRSWILHMKPPMMGQFSTGDYPVAVLVVIFLNAFFIGLYFFRVSKERQSDIRRLREELFTLREGPDMQADETAANVTEKEEVNESGQASEHKSKTKILVAAVGNKNILIPVEEVACLYKEGNFIRLKTFREDTYLLNTTLEECMNFLDQKKFFRVNRQFIVNIKACHSFTNEEHGKLELHLLPAHGEDIIISQKRAQHFKEWLNN